MLYKSCADQREDHDWVMNLFFGKSCGAAAKYFQPNDQAHPTAAGGEGRAQKGL
jgi:hypothetical protein